jgi:predicted regulator of Ras-like GTPase activity (Roadblock/LC7/MglB family)
MALRYHQFGGGLDYRGTSIAFDSDGTSVLSRLGLVNGTVPVRDADDVTVAMETTARVGQSFYISIDGGARKQITIESTDTMDVLAARISNILGTKGDAKMADNGSTEFLQIQARSGAVLEIGAGPEGFDALAGLGLKPALPRTPRRRRTRHSSSASSTGSRC